jgi:signal peptidase II
VTDPDDEGVVPIDTDLDTGGAGPRARRGIPLPVVFAVAVAVIVVDQLTKRWALSALGDGHVVDIVWTLRLNLTFNSGMAFSRGQGLGPIIGVLAFVVVIVLVGSLARTAVGVARIAVGLVIGGALGNLCDRAFRSGGGFLRGRVIDFIDLQWWPVFNVADAAVVIGGVLLVLGSVRRSRA